MALAYINCHSDEIEDAQIRLDQPAASARFIGCEGVLSDPHTVTIRRIKAYGFAAVELEKA